jgi:hypothetical protein
MTEETTKTIFHNWLPREIAAMHRGTAWLRSLQTYEWQIARHEIEKKILNPMKGIK